VMEDCSTDERLQQETLCHRQWTDEYVERPETWMRQNVARVLTINVGFVACSGGMSLDVKSQGSEPDSDPETWLLQTLAVTPEASDSDAPKYPGLQEFSRRYGDIHGYVAAVVCIWGVIANLANIVVLTRRKMITPTNVILTWLAVADLLTMAIFLPFCLHFYVLRDRRLPFPSTQSIGWIRFFTFSIISSEH